MFMNTTLAGVTYTDYFLNSVGASAFQLEHDWFTQQNLVIRTASGGAGTLLTSPADYSLVRENSGLSTLVSIEVGSTRNVYHQIQVTNAAYQSCDLYFSGKFIADNIEATDVQYNDIKTATSGDYVVRDDDGYGWIRVSPLSTTNLIDLGTCESATPPAMTGETSNTLVSCTFARSSAVSRNGTYSYKFTKTGDWPLAGLSDNTNTNDLHGLVPGRTYTFNAWVYIPAGDILGTEIYIFIQDYVGAAWVQASAQATNTYDEWQLLTVTKTIDPAAPGAYILFYCANTAGNGEFFYADDISLYDHYSTITLPAAANNTNRQLLISKEDSAAGLVVVDGENAELINLWQTNTLSNQYDNILIRSNGTIWEILNGRAYPITNEPSLGMPHPFPLNGLNLRQIFTGVPATTASTTEIDVSSYVPLGATAIYIEGAIKVGSNTASSLRASKTNVANYDNGIWSVQGYGGDAFMYFPFSGLIRLDANRKFWIYQPAAVITDCEIYGIAYYL
jgi:hypothetical protein